MFILKAAREDGSRFTLLETDDSEAALKAYNNAVMAGDEGSVKLYKRIRSM